MIVVRGVGNVDPDESGGRCGGAVFDRRRSVPARRRRAGADLRGNRPFYWGGSIAATGRKIQGEREDILSLLHHIIVVIIPITPPL